MLTSKYIKQDGEDSFIRPLFNPYTRYARKSRSQTTCLIGHFGALAFDQPDEYAGKAIALAGDEVNPAEIKQALLDNGIELEHGGSELIAEAEAFLASSELYRKFYNWFGTAGPDGRGPYKADVEALRVIHPGLKTLTQWIATELLPSKRRT